MPETTGVIRGAFRLLAARMTSVLKPKMVFKIRFSSGTESVPSFTETGHRLISPVPVEVFAAEN